jgi:hypothetical protein
MAYIRFIVGSESDSPRTQSGLFTELEFLKNENQLQPYQENLVKETFDFFNDNLPVPPYSKKNWGLDAISWFKDDAIEFIDKMRDLVTILEENGFQVRTLVIEQPGMILYEDEFQIVSKNRTH